MTDGRTDAIKYDSGRKSSWWITTVYEGIAWTDIKNWMKDNTKMPDVVRAIHGGEEVCPKTNRLHMQLAFNTTHIRWSQMRALLPGVHIEPARKSFDVVKYCMKKETAAGAKEVTANATPYYTTELVCIELAKHWPTLEQAYEHKLDKPDKIYWFCVNAVLMKLPALASVLQQSQLQKFFQHTAKTWKIKAEAANLLAAESITRESPGD